MAFSKKTVLIIGGCKQVGKDTLANMLWRSLDHKPTVLHFADPLKELLLDLFYPCLLHKHLSGSGADKETIIPELMDPETGKPGVSGRKLMTWYGTQFRKADPNLWTRKTAWNICKAQSKVVVIADQRMESELDLNSVSPIEHKIYRVRLDRKTGFERTHLSERVMEIPADKYDENLSNEGSIDELFQVAERLSARLIKMAKELEDEQSRASKKQTGEAS